MSIANSTRSVHTSSKRLTSVAALCFFFTVACGGHAIPIGGEPIDTDDTDTVTTDTTTRDTTTVDTSDDVTTDTTNDDNATSGDGNTGSEPNVPGVMCAQYAACDLETPCAAGDCISFPECGGAICIPADEACKLSCPIAEECMILESYPSQIACNGKVPAIPGTPNPLDECTKAGGKCLPADQSAPPTYTVGNFECNNPEYKCWVPLSTEPSEPTGGVSCDNRQVCDAETACPGGQTCLDFPEIGLALCISSDEACKLSCPDPSTCVIAESYPGHLSCDAYLEATCEGGGVSGDAGVPAEVECDAYATCDALDPCEAGSCLVVPGCEKPLCIDAELACKQACNEENCRIAESYPGQLFCSNDDTEPGNNPDEPVSSNDAGAAEPGWPGPDGGDADVE